MAQACPQYLRYQNSTSQKAFGQHVITQLFPAFFTTRPYNFELLSDAIVFKFIYP